MQHGAKSAQQSCRRSTAKYYNIQSYWEVESSKAFSQKSMHRKKCARLTIILCVGILAYREINFDYGFPENTTSKRVYQGHSRYKLSVHGQLHAPAAAAAAGL